MAFSCVHLSVWFSQKEEIEYSGCWLGSFPGCPESNVGDTLLRHVCALNFYLGL